MDKKVIVRLNSEFSRRIANWSDNDRSVLAVLCEGFEESQYDALYVLAERILLPTSYSNGRVEKQVFELALERGLTMFLLTQLAPDVYMISD